MQREIMGNGSFNLPPGFVFSPTDEELVLHFLYSKATLLPCHPNIIPDLDLSLLDPWDLNGKALSSGNEYYFFTKVKEKWATENGYWREIGVTNHIFSALDEKVGMKKYHVFHVGEDPQVTETNWVMHEYHICTSGFDTSYQSARRKRIQDKKWSKWVLCRVYEKNKSQNCYRHEDDSGSELSLLDEVYLSLDDDLEEISMPSYINQI
ncbi:hypothetical protein TanjilG_25955 [Lupinus angustifolius]|uniref:NAC domain-containing protein n=1 Tax=Lupinus angustifolius TaxID=3871 RepID=A0A4P1QZB7_LUPAN|nr:PREDICTED: NAC domain-containing protein 104-like [Lupinus angustifolius]OIV98090.1 hypothetical protein TanjilG_25955 [Lupinus angustifolius]